MKYKASAGYDDYTFPEWSAILGWIIFALSILPIPLYYFVIYIREFRGINSEKMVCTQNFSINN